MAKGRLTIDPKKPSLGVRERERLSDQIEEESQYRRGLGQDLPEGGRVGPLGSADGKSLNMERLDERIARNKAKLAELTPDGLTRDQIAEAEREVKELESYLKSHLLSEKQMDFMPSDRYHFSRAVRQSADSKHGEIGGKEYSEKAMRYKELQKRLRPEDPEATSIEKLRPKS